jgi:hypothetical protein
VFTFFFKAQESWINEGFIHQFNLNRLLDPSCSGVINYKQVVRIGMPGIVSDV